MILGSKETRAEKFNFFFVKKTKSGTWRRKSPRFCFSGADGVWMCGGPSREWEEWIKCECGWVSEREREKTRVRERLGSQTGSRSAVPARRENMHELAGLSHPPSPPRHMHASHTLSHPACWGWSCFSLYRLHTEWGSLYKICWYTWYEIWK